ncbi:MAG: gamma-glutamylcyclotransferase family protein, partial [Rhodoglobus sp.]
LLADDDGYFFVEPAAGVSVAGELVTMGERELARADRWEDVPWYVREVTTVRLPDGGQVAAWIYLRPGATGRPVIGGGYALRPRAQVLADARALRAQLEGAATIDR